MPNYMKNNLMGSFQDEQAAEIAKKAYKESRPVIDVAHEETGISVSRLKKLLDPSKLTKGGIKS